MRTMTVHFDIFVTGERYSAHSIPVEVKYELSQSRIDQAWRQHNQRLGQERARHRANMREMAGHQGADELGNQMMNASFGVDQEAAELAARQLGVTGLAMRAYGGTGQRVQVPDRVQADALAARLRGTAVAIVLQ